MCYFGRCQDLSLYSVGDIITEWTRGQVILESQGKGKCRPITGHEGPEGE